MSITIYHNPDCGTSRNTLAMVRQSGEEPEITEYLKAPPSRERLVELIKAMGLSVRQKKAPIWTSTCAAQTTATSLAGERPNVVGEMTIVGPNPRKTFTSPTTLRIYWKYR